MNTTTLFLATAAAAALGSFSSAAYAQCPVTFAPAVSFPCDSPTSIVVGDLNGDGLPDLVIGGKAGTATTCTVLLNIDNGGFSPPTSPLPPSFTLTGLGTMTTQVAPLADFNADGKLDMAVTGATSSVAIMLGDGAGGFTAAPSLTMAPVVNRVIPADFDGDGKVDLFMLGITTPMLAYGNGDGTFAAPVAISGAGTGGSNACDVGDFNGDGRPDVAIRLGATNTIAILLGTGVRGSGAFTAGDSFFISAPSTIRATDMNQDGKLDLVVTESSNVQVFRGSGTGTFVVAEAFSIGFPIGVISPAGDVNGDGRPDLLAVMFSNNALITGNAEGLPLGGGLIPESASVNAVIDADSDGRPDVVSGNSGGPQAIKLQLNRSARSVKPVLTQQPQSRTAATGESVSLTGAATSPGGTVSYRWRKYGIMLADGGNISGAATRTLTINPVSTDDTAYYELEAYRAAPCDATATLSIRAVPALVAVSAPPAPPRCVADLGVQGGLAGSDGRLDNNDFIMFIDAFFNHTGCP